MKRNLLITALLCSSGLYASAHSSAPIPAPAGQTEAVAADYEYTGEMSINMSTGHLRHSVAMVLTPQPGKATKTGQTCQLSASSVPATKRLKTTWMWLAAMLQPL